MISVNENDNVNLQSHNVNISAFCITSIAVLTSVYFWKKSKVPVQGIKCKASPLKPEKWVKVGTVKRLILYPIKSCAGKFVEKGIITTLGLKCHYANIRDRDFMVVDEFGKQVTMTKHPKMSMAKIEINADNTLTVTAPDMPPLTFTYPRLDGNDEKLCRVKHDSHVKALDCGDDVAQWFCEFLNNSSLRVYYHHLNVTQRTFEPYMYKCPQFEQSDMGAFHNETAYMLCAEESIDELNKHLNKDSSWKNWRPTILIDQVNEPFAEVNWSFVRIGSGNGILKTAVPCYRCPLTTVDNETGILPKDGEPLKTLRESKIGHDKVTDKAIQEVLRNKGVMGLRLGLYLPAGEGAVISAGDTVYAALL